MVQRLRSLPKRELVFVQSLKRHGFRFLSARERSVIRVKRRVRYIALSTKREDASGIDFWVNLVGEYEWYPIQVTQRGVRLQWKHKGAKGIELTSFLRHAEIRLREKRRLCKRHRVALVLVRDFDGSRTNSTIAWGDRKALFAGLQTLNGRR